MTKSLGDYGENLAANLLTTKGFRILDTNWKTKYCEIDIIAEKDEVVYFCEVKYRTSSNWGSGFEYITQEKLRKMNFAARIWLTNNDWQGASIMLAIEVDANHNINLVEVI